MPSNKKINNKVKHTHKIYFLGIVILLLIFINKIIQKPSIVEVQISGIASYDGDYECFFFDKEFNIKEGDQIKGITKNYDVTCIYFKVPEKTGQSFRFRLDFGSNYLDSIVFNDISTLYSDGKIKKLTSEKLKSNISYYSTSIKEIKTENDQIILLFNNSNPFDPHIVFNIDNRIHLINSIFLIICSILLLIIVSYSLDITLKESPIILIVALGYLSFFSSIIYNNISIIILCVYAILSFLITKKRTHNTFIVTSFITLLAINLIWSFIPYFNISSTAKIFEKYLVFLFIPLAFNFIEIKDSVLNNIFKTLLLISTLLLFNNIFSYILYVSPDSLRLNSEAIFFHFLSFDHSSYIFYFYTSGFISILYLYKNKKANIWFVIIYLISLYIYSVITSARIGIMITLFYLLFLFIISIKNKSNSKKLLGLISGFIIIVSTLLPFSNVIKKVDQTRDIVWTISKENIKDNLLLGLGTGREKTIFTKENLSQYPNANYISSLNNAHNQILNNILQHGIIAGSILYLFIFILIFVSYRKNNMLMLIFLLSTLIFMTTEVVTDRSRGLIFFVLMTCFLWNYNTESRTEFI